MGQNYSKETYVEIINYTHQEIVNSRVYGVNNYDWDGNARPDHNLQHLKISARGGSTRQREEVNALASNCPFNIVLNFSDGTYDEFRVHQKHAIAESDLGYHIIHKSHDIDVGRCADKTLGIKIRNTQQQLQNERSEEKNREGQAAMRKKQYEAAMRSFDEALGLANQSSTINNIKSNKSQACNEFGKECLQRACEMENDSTQDKSQEAQSKFNQARNLFQQAQSICSSSEYQNNLDLVNLKIDGNRLFNEANELEKQAFKLFEGEKEDYTEAQNKYKQALIKYKQAVKTFEQGARIDKNKFDDSVKVANEMVQEVKKAIDNIDQAELNYNISKVKVDEEKKKKSGDDEVVNTKLQEQVDVVIS